MKPASRRQEKYRKCRYVMEVLLSVFILSILPGVALAEGRPQIQVDFSLEGDLFAGLTAEARTGIETSIEEKFSVKAEKRWGFIDWSHDAAGAADTANWNITLAVEIKQVTMDNGQAGVGFVGTLAHSGQLASETFAFEQTEINETIYPMGRSVPFNDATALEDDISRQLDRQLDSLFESWEVKAYLQKVPIVEQVIADKDNKRVLVPVKISDLRTQGDSVLAVIFISADNRNGQLDLKTALEVPEEGEHKGYVIGMVTDFVFFGETIETPTWWDETLSAVLESPQDVKVYMKTYSPSLAGSSSTDGNVVLDPDM